MIKKSKLFFILIIITIFIGCKENTTSVQNIPTQKALEVPTLNMKPLKMVYITGGSKNFMTEGLQMLAEYITNKTGIPVEFKIYKKYTDVIKDFQNKKLDTGYLSGLMYIKLAKEVNIIPLVTPTEDGLTTHRSLLVTREDSGMKTLEDLKGRRFSFVNKESTSGYLFPRVMLAKKGITDPDKYFSEVEYSQDHLSSLISIYNGYVDAGMVSETVFNSAEAGPYSGKMNVIMKTEGIPLGCFVVSKDLSADYVDKLTSSLLEVGKTSETEELAQKLKIDGYEKAKDSDYDSIRTALQTLTEIENSNDSKNH